MGMSGFICHDDYYDRLKRLSNEEVGNLFRQLMLYHAGRFDEMEDFIDGEGIAFDFIANDIDRIEQKYNATCEKNRQNGSKGGRPRKQLKAEETQNNPAKPNETDNNPTKAYKDKDKYKDKDSLSFIADDDAQAIQHEHDLVFTAAEDAGFKMSNSVRAALIRLYADNGLEKMVAGINECAIHGAPNLAYLGAVLKGGKKPIKVLPAQDFQQRDYSKVDEQIMSELAEGIRSMKAGEAG